VIKILWIHDHLVLTVSIEGGHFERNPRSILPAHPGKSLNNIIERNGSKMRKLLVAIDGSDYALKAVDYVSKHFSDEDVQIVLFHVLPYVPAEFWDDGHILTGEEKKARKGVVDKWLSHQTLKLEPIFSAASKVLAGSGIKEDRISAKWISDSTDVAASILEEARRGGYDTLIIGRCGHNSIKNRLGSVAEKLVRQGSGTALCIVEVTPISWTV